MQDPARIALALEEIASLLTLSARRERDAGGRFKAQTFERGAHLVRGLSDQLATLIGEGRLTEIEGVGPSLSRQIHELWSTGSSSLLSRLRSEHPVGAAELSRLKGMTSPRIVLVASELGISSIEQLREACEAGLVRALPGFGQKTEQRLLRAIAEHAAQGVEEKRILLADAIELAERVQQQLRELAEVQLVGAARRGEETVSLLELSVLGGERVQLVSALSALSGVAYLDGQSGHGYMAAGVPLRVHFSEPDQAGATLLASTGSYAHVHALRKRATLRGLSLDEASRLRMADGSLHPANQHERTLYEALDLHFVPPELRTGGSELARAEHDDFSQLVQVVDIKGMVHCHTTYSDGKNSIEEMARAAARARHAVHHHHRPLAHRHYAGGVTLDALERQWDEIREVEQRVNIRILRGTESDILGDGSLDYPDAVLEQFDVVIASIHARLQMSREAMTERLVRAMELPVFKIWGHALGRLLLQRESHRLRRAARARRAGALARCHRAERRRAPARPAARLHPRGARAQPAVRDLGRRPLDARARHAALGVTMARRGGVLRGEVLNTLDAEQFLERVRPA